MENKETITFPESECNIRLERMLGIVETMEVTRSIRLTYGEDLDYGRLGVCVDGNSRCPYRRQSLDSMYCTNQLFLLDIDKNGNPTTNLIYQGRILK